MSAEIDPKADDSNDMDTVTDDRVRNLRPNPNPFHIRSIIRKTIRPESAFVYFPSIIDQINKNSENKNKKFLLDRVHSRVKTDTTPTTAHIDIMHPGHTKVPAPCFKDHSVNADAVMGDILGVLYCEACDGDGVGVGGGVGGGGVAADPTPASALFALGDSLLDLVNDPIINLDPALIYRSDRLVKAYNGAIKSIHGASDSWMLPHGADAELSDEILAFSIEADIVLERGLLTKLRHVLESAAICSQRLASVANRVDAMIAAAMKTAGPWELTDDASTCGTSSSKTVAPNLVTMLRSIVQRSKS